MLLNERIKIMEKVNMYPIKEIVKDEEYILYFGELEDINNEYVVKFDSEEIKFETYLEALMYGYLYSADIKDFKLVFENKNINGIQNKAVYLYNEILEEYRKVANYESTEDWFVIDVNNFGLYQNKDYDKMVTWKEIIKQEWNIDIDNNVNTFDIDLTYNEDFDIYSWFSDINNDSMFYTSEEGYTFVNCYESKMKYFAIK